MTGLAHLRSVVDGCFIGPLAMRVATYEDGYCVRLMSNGKCIRTVPLSLGPSGRSDEALLDEIVRQVKAVLS